MKILSTICYYVSLAVTHELNFFICYKQSSLKARIGKRGKTMLGKTEKECTQRLLIAKQTKILSKGGD